MSWLSYGHGAAPPREEARAGRVWMTLLWAAALGGIGGAWRGREAGDGRGMAGLWHDGRKPGQAAAAATRDASGERAIRAQHGKQMLRAGDEIAFGVQAAAQPAAGDSTQWDVLAFDVMAARYPLSWWQQVRSVNEDEVAHGALKLLDADVAVAAALALSDAPAREPRNERQEP